MISLKDKRVLITGASTGIGKRTLELLLKKEAQIYFCGLEKDKVNEVTQTLGVDGIVADLSKEEELIQFFESGIKKLGGIDILINNAGAAISKSLEKHTREDFDYLFALNAIAPARLSQLTLPYFKAQGYGDILNIGATGAHYGFKGAIAYASSKAALISLSKCLSSELREFGTRVTHLDPSRCFDEDTEDLKTQKLLSIDVAETIVAALELSRNAFIPQLSVWGVNP